MPTGIGKMTLIAYVFPKLQTAKDVVRQMLKKFPVSEDPSTLSIQFSNMIVFHAFFSFLKVLRNDLSRLLESFLNDFHSCFFSFFLQNEILALREHLAKLEEEESFYSSEIGDIESEVDRIVEEFRPKIEQIEKEKNPLENEEKKLENEMVS